MACSINVEIYDPDYFQNQWKRGFILYKFRANDDLGQDIEKALIEAEYLEWRSQYIVIDLMFKTQLELTPNIRTDTSAIWRVYLGLKKGEFEIKYFNAVYSMKYGTLDSLKEIDWRKTKR
ncbi:MAG: hypothetical protein AAF702_28150 [Chloroflexota bacterium]